MRILLFILLFIPYSLFSQIKQGMITYTASIDTISLLKKIKGNRNTSKKYKDVMSKFVSKSEDITFYLLFKENESIFYSANLKKLKNEGKKSKGLTGVHVDDSSLFYNNNKTKEKFKQNFAFDEILIKVDKTKWKVTQNSKEIGNYICFKATTIFETEGRSGKIRRKVTAWFTPQIPISFGVQGFTGLPGLILELNIENRALIRASKIELNPTRDIKIKKPIGKIITYKEYIEFLKRARN